MKRLLLILISASVISNATAQKWKATGALEAANLLSIKHFMNMLVNYPLLKSAKM